MWEGDDKKMQQKGEYINYLQIFVQEKNDAAVVL